MKPLTTPATALVVERASHVRSTVARPSSSIHGLIGSHASCTASGSSSTAFRGTANTLGSLADRDDAMATVYGNSLCWRVSRIG